MNSDNKTRRIVGLVLMLPLLAWALPAAAQSTPTKNVSPELTGELTKELKVTPEQATGGAGSLFSLAKTRLKPEEFSKVSAAVPGMDALLGAAPKQENSMLSAIPGKSSGLAGVTSQFKALGLTPEMASKFVPILTKFVSGKGGASVGQLLANALK
jgi:hypothetical protein